MTREARDALYSLDPGMSRPDWVRAMTGAKAAGLDFDDVLVWCEGGDNFKSERDCRSVWNSISIGGGITEKTLFGMARESGYLPDAKATKPMTKSPQKPTIDPNQFWNDCERATETHAYVQKKLGLTDGIKTYFGTLKIAGNAVDGALALPVKTLKGSVASIQLISGSGKYFLPGLTLPSDGCFILGKMGPGVAYVVEGIGHAWTVHQATGRPAIVCFGWGRVAGVAEAVRSFYPESSLTIVPDGGKQDEAELIAQKLGCAYVPLPSDWGKNYDINDLHREEGFDAVLSVLAGAKVPDVLVFPKESGSVADLMASPPPALNWFVHERLLRNRGHLVTGIGGSSKTRFLYHLAIAAIIGRLPWGWQVTRRGAAFLLLTEDDEEDVHRSIFQHCAHLTDEERELVRDNLYVFARAAEDNTLLQVNTRGGLEETDNAIGLQNKLKGIPNLVFVGLDAAIGLSEGDEMSPRHQKQLGLFADRLAIKSDACVVLASHAAKNVGNADEVASHSSRGSGALTDAVRAEIVLRTMTPAEAKKFGVTSMEERLAYLSVSVPKANHVPPSGKAPVWLKRGEGGLLFPADIEEREPGDQLSRKDEACLDVLKRMCETTVPKLAEWRTECVAAGILSAKNESSLLKAMQRTVATLQKHNLITKGIKAGFYVPVSDEE